jgi:CRISPR-associated protein Cmr2
MPDATRPVENEQEFWKRKLLAYLHDPPEKALDVSGHTKRRETYVRAAAGNPSEISWFFDRVCDHTAAAADRFCFPEYPHGKAGFDPANGAPFHHPLGGANASTSLLVFEKGCPAADQASLMLAKAQDRLGLDGKSFEDKFWLHWRFWQEEVSEGSGEGKDPSLAFLPADTRIPDHTIWTHAAVTSALQGCVEVEETVEGPTVKEFRPAFLLMQFGPVQDFISQARTTRDLWSGSYLMSWIVAHAIKAVTDRIGPDSVLFPSLCGQPLFDFLNKERYERLGRWGATNKLHSDEQILTPNLPNRFLAVVPESMASDLAKEAREAAECALRDGIGEKCWQWLVKQNPAGDPGAETRKRWEQQLRQFLSVTWQIVPWKNRTVEESMDRFEQLPAGLATAGDANCSPAEALRRAHAAAVNGVPNEMKDPRNYKHKSWQDAQGFWKSEIVPKDGPAIIDNPAFAWAAHYAEAEFLLAARRNVRDFAPWGQWENGCALDLPERHAVKDALSGKEEVIGSEDWQKSLPEVPGHLFKEGDRLGAMNLIKRVWPRVVLEPLGLRRTPRFNSVPAVAAADWVIETLDHLGENPEAWAAALDFQSHLVAERANIPEEIPDSANETEWFTRLDAGLFHAGEWDRMGGGDAEAKAKAKSLLSRLHQKAGDSPSRYVAILAMDGDSMGAWVSGAMSPSWKAQLSQETIRAFFDNESIPGHAHRRKLLDSPRHVSPSYHLQFSEALGNFSIYLAGAIVEAFHGRLIYSGGDDVVAMLPARHALPCALALRKAFRGEADLADAFPGCQSLHESHEGFVALDGESAAFKKTKRFLPRGVPLVVPGMRADISAGIACGHMHAPLQNLVQAARHALDRAKADPDKGAFAVSLFKRSGESIEWAAKWNSRAISVAGEFLDLTESGSLSGKFPYALAGLLRPYEAGKFGDPWKIAPCGGFDPVEVFPIEIAHVLDRQSDTSWSKEDRVEFEKLVVDYLKEDCAGRPLTDFLGPFLATAFIHRSAD